MHEELTDADIRQVEWLASSGLPACAIAERLDLTVEEVMAVLDGGVYDNVISVE